MKRVSRTVFSPLDGEILLDLGGYYISYRSWSLHHMTGAEYL